MEAKVLAACGRSRDAYEYVRTFVRESDFSEHSYRIWQELDRYYEADKSASEVDWDIVYSRIERALPNEKVAAQFETAIDTIEALNVSAQNVANEFLEVRRDAVGDALSRALQSRDSSELYALHQEYGELLDATEVGEFDEVDIDLYDLFANRLAEQNKVRLLPGVLSDLIGGGLRPGDTVVVAGRPNAGKSTFVINAASGFVRKGLRVLYIENEDSAERTLGRFTRRLIGRDINWARQYPQETVDQAMELGYDRFHLMKLTPGSPSEIEAHVRRLQPDVLIVNQLRGVAHEMHGNLTQNLEKAQIAIRNIGQRYDLITIVVTQANAPPKDARGQLIEKPRMGVEDIDSSLTGVPGATDFVFIIGTTKAMRRNKLACINIAKSKDDGDGDYCYVRVDTSIDKLFSEEG